MTEMTKKELKELKKKYKDEYAPYLNWIIENKLAGNSEMDMIKDMKFISYPYEKYNDTAFAEKLPNGFNLRIADFGEVFGDGSKDAYRATHIFQELFAERLCLALAYFKGKTNDEIKAELEKIDNKSE